MSATVEAPAKVTREVLEDRWRTIMVDVDLFNGEETNSKAWDKLSEGIRHVAGRMVHGVNGDAEYSDLTRTEESIHEHIRTTILAFAERIEASR